MSKRLPELASPFAKAQKKIKKFLSRNFENITIAQRFWAGFCVLCILTTLLINNPLWRISDIIVSALSKTMVSELANDVNPEPGGAPVQFVAVPVRA